MSFFGHNLHLAITNSKKCEDRCAQALGFSRKIVSTFSISWNKRCDLVKTQLYHNLSSHTLIVDYPNRWWSVHKMVASILEQITAICLVLSADHKCSHLLPTWQHTEVIEVINNVLSLLANLTDLLSGEQYTSVSSIKQVPHTHFGWKECLTYKRFKMPYSYWSGFQIFGFKCSKFSELYIIFGPKV